MYVETIMSAVLPSLSFLSLKDCSVAVGVATKRTSDGAKRFVEWNGSVRQLRIEFEDGYLQFLEGDQGAERLVRVESPKGTNAIFEGERGAERLVLKEFNDGNKDYYEGDKGDERLVRKELANGQKLFYEGEKGVESLVYAENPNGLKNFFVGDKGVERLVRGVFVNGIEEFFEGDRGAERMVRKEYPNGLKNFYKGEMGAERKVRAVFVNGIEEFYDGGKGAERLVRKQFGNYEARQFYAGEKGAEHVVRVHFPGGGSWFYEGAKGDERFVRASGGLFGDTDVLAPIEAGTKLDEDIHAGVVYSGTLKFKNGWTFEGSFKGNKRNGEGMLYSPDKSIKWKGLWANGARTNTKGRLFYRTKDESMSVVEGWWPPGKPFMDVTLRAKSIADEQEFDYGVMTSLRNNIKKTLDSNFPIVQVPEDGMYVAEENDVVLRPVDSNTWKSIEKLFEESDKREVGIGADAQKYLGGGQKYHKLVPIKAFDVDYSQNVIERQWERTQYQHSKRMAYCITAGEGNYSLNRREDFNARKLLAGPKAAFNPDKRFVHVRTDRLPGLAKDKPLDHDINEVFLLHGTRSSNVIPMLCNGPTNAFSTAGRFGAAAYFSEDPSKSDQYCKIEVNDIDKGPDGFLKKMLGIRPHQYEDAANSGAVPSRKDVFYMFIVRVALGCVARITAEEFDKNQAGRPGTPANNETLMFDEDQHVGNPYQPMRYTKDLNKQFQSVMVEDWSTTDPGHLRFNEFMVYNNGVGMVAKITHLVAYKRIVDAPSDDYEYVDELTVKYNGDGARPWSTPTIKDSNGQRIDELMFLQDRLKDMNGDDE